MYQRTSIPNIIRRVEDGAQFCDAEEGSLPIAVEYRDWRQQGNEPAPYVAPFDQAAALQRARDRRKPILDALVGIGLQAMSSSDEATLQAVLTARQGLLDITKDAGVLAATSDEEFDAAVLGRYHQLVAAAPATVVNAFTESAT